MAIPLLWPPIPPLADLPGHMGRYAIQLGTSPLLARWYAAHWTPIGNLGVDLLMVPLGHLVGVELGTKLVTVAIPPLHAAGYLLVARELHGRVPPTAPFALPLILGYPFQFGFLNHALAVALAFLAFALWLRLGRIRRHRLRAGLFVLLSVAIWTAHAFGWAILSICCFAAELVRARDAGVPLLRVPVAAAIACWPLAPPVLLLLLWHERGIAGDTTGFFDWQLKLGWLESALRDRWKRLDGDAATLLVLLVGLGVVRLLRFERTLLVTAALMAVVYALLPRILIGSDYADMRMAPVLMAVAVLALAPRDRGPRWAAPLLAGAALAFFALRIAAGTASLLLASQQYERQLGAVPHIPPGARVYVLVAPDCPRGWAAPRLDHLGSVAIVRRQAFVNDQFVNPGAEIVSVRLPLPRAFAADPSQIVRLPGCDRPEPLLGDQLAHFPRDRFDLVWLINVVAAARPRDPELRTLWKGEAGALYRIERPRPVRHPRG